MDRYIALLRGVNVGGVTIKMAELADLFRALGFAEVKTVLASGNVVFKAEGARTGLRERIEAALRERFGYEAWVHVLTADELAAIVSAYPFEARDGWHRYVLFLMGEEPREDLLAAPIDEGLEQIAPGERVIYWTVERGHTLDSAFGKRSNAGKNKVLTTNRNLNTLQKLLN